MNNAIVLFLGVFFTFAFAWTGLVLMPNQQLKGLEPQAVAGTSDVNPRPYSGLEQTGREVYQAEGCVYCHTQQVRGGTYQADVERGWGPRRSHPQDYLHDRPVLLGTMRTGPDLSNIGARQPSAMWHYLHLLNPQKVSPGSIMAPYAYLFETRKIEGQASPDALTFDQSWSRADGRPEAGYEVIPTDRAKALVAYLRCLDHTYAIETPANGGKP